MKRFIRAKWLSVILFPSIIGLLVYTGFHFSASIPGSPSTEPGTGMPIQATEASAAAAASSAEAGLANGFPDESLFVLVAENEKLELRFSPETGHFIVKDKSAGRVWRSFPNPEQWNEEENSNAWNVHLRSPIMFRYVEFNVRQDLLKESNFIEQRGTVASFERLEDGVRFKLEMPDIGFVVPIEVRLRDDFVEATVRDEGLIDGKEPLQPGEAAGREPGARLASIRPYPFFGAATSIDPEGYVFIPDGSGALIRFRSDREPNSGLYEGIVYGDDWAYSSNSSLPVRLPVTMPVFGIKSDNQAMIGIIREGAEYATILAAPSKSFNQYNWVTPEFQIRQKYRQPTNTSKTEGILVYSDERIRSDLSTRYYLIDSPEPEYADMASRFRTYLVEETGVRTGRLSGSIPLHLSLLGADTESGFLLDSYLPLTTTDEAKRMIGDLNSLGIDAMSIVYEGWQRNGYSSYGGPFPVDSRIGGRDGMKAFIDYAHSKQIPVYLNAEHYSFNNTGRGGFRKSRDGLRDRGQSLIEYRIWNSDDRLTFASPLFVEASVSDDLAKAQAINADGYLFGAAIGSFVNSDFNERYPVTRVESRSSQERILQQTKNRLGNVQITRGNMYTWAYAGHVQLNGAEYSRDIFVDETVPFIQMALHGLLSYSLDYANQSDDYRTHFLKGIEYGAEPSFIVSYAPTRELVDTYSLNRFYSTDYRDWATSMVIQYQQFNEALGDVRDQYISGHRKLAEGVYETTYANGKQIIVNYNDTMYSTSRVTVNAKDFVVLKGGNRA
ncbi:DUF5696 domain-containing protein [Paenibacillus sp. J5C_2022]|uniref:DUF5696 domain-containing protein n=1 Tax=Paenibacillus sp. J5C2022 TaxID=2977129 RepID=UPI0021D06F1B|nr:DUF5696 domain-containing protein [Paenibacillus sp. J5C2022]MCU6708845.1 DUF5696 domain-containing protein [Paenibacillus sp. J5C2022]